MKKRIGIAVVIIVLLCLFGIAGCTDKHEFARQRIKEITEIEVPNDSKILFHHIDDTFVNGRHAQYTVFEFEVEPVDWLKENAFLEGRDEKNERCFWDDFGFATIEIEDIPNEYIPDFENTYYWIQKQRVRFFYYPCNMMLMVLISGS